MSKKTELIYKEIANKEPTRGCKMIHYWDSYRGNEETDVEYLFSDSCSMFFLNLVEMKLGRLSGGRILIAINKDKLEDDFEIIGHPVMIGDVLDFIEKSDLSEFQGDYGFDLLNKWEKKRLPIEEQSEECIDFIYNLILENA